MTDNGHRIATYEARRDSLARDGMYLPDEEHASCGVGLVAAIDGKPRREVVEYGITALQSVWHRGAVDADGRTGDGAGMHVQIPGGFFRDQIRRTGHEPREDELIAVGQVFLPRNDFGAQEVCRTIVESEILRLRLLHLWLAAGAGEHLGAGRQGERDAARDRADPDRQPQGRRRRDLRARALRHPAAHREGGAGGAGALASTSARCRAGRSSTRA